MKAIKTLFVIGILSLMALPIVMFDVRGTVSEKENRSLAARPALFGRGGVLNGRVFSECDSYLGDRFGGRSRLVSLNKRIAYGVLGANVFNEQAIRGANGWCFYTGTMEGCDHTKLSDFYKTNLLTAEQLAAFRESVAAAVGWCAERGIKAAVIICPNKHSVYPEKYPFRPRPDGITRADQLCAALDELGVPYVFPRDELVRQKNLFGYPLYWETDTHWNPAGAHVAFAQILRLLEGAFPGVPFPHVEYETTVSHSTSSGDLLPILGIEESRSTRPALSPVGAETPELYTYLHYDFMRSTHTEGADRTLPRAVVFHDSFFGALEPFVSPLFSDCRYYFTQFREKDKELLLADKPDVVLFEAIEWRAHSVCGALER